MKDIIDSSNTVPFTKKEVKAYLDRAIRFWRKKMSTEQLSPEDELMAACYIDAFQSVRRFLFGKLLESDEKEKK